jgi:hypothetical protein
MYKNTLKRLLALSLLFTASYASATTWSVLNPSNPGFAYSVYPATDIRYYDGNINNQSAANIETVIETQFGLASDALTFASSCDSATSSCTNATGGASGNTNTFTSNVAFNYLAVHFGRAELLFHWLNPINNFSFTDTNNAFRGVSNYRAYSDGLSQVPIPAAGWLFAPALLGFVGLRRKKI